MSKFRHTFHGLAVVIFTLTVTSLAQAQATRTWVSGVGDDANPCSRTAPCKTFAGAISKTAVNGEIDCIDPGGFGAVTITKSITIDGGGTFGSILAAGTQGIIVNDATNTAVVTLRNLSINGAGSGTNGINVLAGKSLHVENVEIFGFTGNGINAALNSAPVAGFDLFIDDVDIRDLRGAASIGVRLSAPSQFIASVMDHVRIERVPTGVQAGNLSVVAIRNSLITLGTTGVAMLGGSNGIIENTMLTSHTTGISTAASSTTRISQVSIILCSTGIGAGGTVQSSGNNRILGNTSDGLTPTVVNPK
ncbi:MAG TPA: hypothetical protein VE135_27385 [Pyrinomonadaceae bacterium]|nr:hypothetical protein [Pyrinomonadaceae bacterium]